MSAFAPNTRDFSSVDQAFEEAGSESFANSHDHVARSFEMSKVARRKVRELAPDAIWS
jgi:hypothetical protein